MSPSPEDSSTDSRSACSSESTGEDARTSTSCPEFSPEERTLLLKLAHEAVASALEGRQLSLTPPSPHLAEPRGAFTTIYVRGDLRGCVGYVFPIYSLYQTVAETARSAAFEDTRFWPVTREEVSELEVSLSILSPLKPIRPEEIEIGRHGLLLTVGSHRGLLLPQVPVEHGWDRTTFLEQTCRKAGLPTNAWQKGAKLEAFTAEVFGDRDS
ncbi:MAG: AmmeMemoRadiSam system protein A [Acidobacteriia bacterium]|nr:AmmeMemoRadiSam system protein A [Terriglobia bacterium]